MVEVITLRNLWAGYGKTPILEDINLVVRELDFIGLIGSRGGDILVMSRKCWNLTAIFPFALRM